MSIIEQRLSNPSKMSPLGRWAFILLIKELLKIVYCTKQAGAFIMVHVSAKQQTEIISKKSQRITNEESTKKDKKLQLLKKCQRCKNLDKKERKIFY